MSAVAAHVEFSGGVFVSAAVTPGGEDAALQVIYTKHLCEHAWKAWDFLFYFIFLNRI